MGLTAVNMQQSTPHNIARSPRLQTGQSHMALLTAPKSQATCAASAKWRGGRLADEESSQEDKVRG